MYSLTIAISVWSESEPLTENFVLAMAEYAEKLKEEGAFRGKLERLKTRLPASVHRLALEELAEAHTR